MSDFEQAGDPFLLPPPQPDPGDAGPFPLGRAPDGYRTLGETRATRQRLSGRYVALGVLCGVRAGQFLLAIVYGYQTEFPGDVWATDGWATLVVLCVLCGAATFAYRRGQPVARALSAIADVIFLAITVNWWSDIPDEMKGRWIFLASNVLVPVVSLVLAATAGESFVQVTTTGDADG